MVIRRFHGVYPTTSAGVDSTSCSKDMARAGNQAGGLPRPCTQSTNSILLGVRNHTPVPTRKINGSNLDEKGTRVWQPRPGILAIQKTSQENIRVSRFLLAQKGSAVRPNHKASGTGNRDKTLLDERRQPNRVRSGASPHNPACPVEASKYLTIPTFI
jgi:hypothetical protein